MVEHKLEQLRIVTRCTTRAQFVTAYHRFCTPTSCFIPSSDLKPIGTAAAFSIRLADGETLLRGEGVILEAWETKQNPFKRSGVLLGIHRLDDDCDELFEQLVLPRSAAVKIPPASQLQMLLTAAPSPVAELETPTIEMPPLALPEEPRVPGSSIILPANPLTEMTDELLDAFIESTVTTASRPEPDAIPEPAPPEQTVKTPHRDIVATLLGMVPLQMPRVFAAPVLISTEGIDRMIAAPELATGSRPVIVRIPDEPTVMTRNPPRVAAVRQWWLPMAVATMLVVAFAVWFAQ